MTKEEAIEWVEGIKEKYIHGGDEAFDDARRKALDMAIEAIKAETVQGYAISKQFVSDAILQKISELNAQGEKAIPISREFIRFKRFVDGITPIRAEADTVEVVRCKDCVYWKYRANYNGDEWGACLFIEELEDDEHWTEDTDFCSYGDKLNNPDDSFLTADPEACKEQKSKLDLISRAEAIEAVRLETGMRGLLGRGDILGILLSLPSADAVSREEYHNLLMASNDIDRALREYQAKDENQSSEAVQGWIPCSERLPEEKEIVLIYDSIGHIDFGQYDRGLWYWLAEACADYWMRNDGVIAWMPLPMPYKGGERSEE